MEHRLSLKAQPRRTLSTEIVLLYRKFTGQNIYVEVEQAHCMGKKRDRLISYDFCSDFCINFM